MTWLVQEIDGDRSRECDSRSEAESVKADMEGLGMDVEIVSPGKTDGGEVQVQAPEEDIAAEGLPSNPPMDTDPLSWIPEEFVDTIDGTVAINRKGFSVLKQHFDIDTTADCVVGPEETDFTFCRVKAVATTPEGTVAEAHGSAHVDRGDDPWLLLEMADTRAKKRALSDATGVGMVAVEELQNKP